MLVLLWLYGIGAVFSAWPITLAISADGKSVDLFDWIFGLGFTILWPALMVLGYVAFLDGLIKEVRNQGEKYKEAACDIS